MSALVEKLEALSAKAPCTRLPINPKVLARYMRNGAMAEICKPDGVELHEFQHDADLIVELVNNLPEIIKALKATSKETDHG